MAAPAPRLSPVAERALADMDPQMAAVVRRSAELGAPYGNPYDRPTLAETRAVFETLFGYWAKGGPRMRRTEEMRWRGPHGSVRLRLHVPSDRPDLPVIVYMHGGGWSINSIDTHDRLMRELARRSGLAVLGVDYSKAPEHKFPAALDECVAVVRRLRRRGRRWGLDPRRILIGGDSAGAQLAISTCLVLRDAGERPLAGQILIYGGFDTDFATPSHRRYGAGGYLMTTADVELLWGYHLRGEADKRNPLATPLNADLHDLPPAVVVCAELDTLADENRAMAAKLSAAGVPCDLLLFAGVCHGFMRLPHHVDTAARAHDALAAWARQRVATPSPRA